MEDLGIDEEHVAVDPESGEVFLDLASVDEEAWDTVDDDETLASSEEDWILAVLDDPDVQPLLPELTAAIDVDDRPGYDRLVETLGDEVASRHDFEALFASGILLATGDGRDESLAAPTVNNCYSYLVPLHGRDRTHFCQENASLCHSARHFPCHGDHTNGTFYGFAVVNRGGTRSCSNVRTVQNAVMCHGRQQTRICNATQTSCGRGGAETSGTWKNSTLLRRDARVGS